MVLNIRQRQRDAILRMLNFNEAQTALKRREQDSNTAPYKILILDDYSKSVIAPLIGVQDLRQKGGVTLHLSIASPREPIPDVPAVYFVRPTPENIDLILKDAEGALYDCLHLNFVSQIQRPLLDRLAEGAVRRSCAQQVAKVFDQYMAYIALEPNMFSLGLPDTYLELNNPSAKDHEIEASTSQVVDGLFSALASMACVPIIRCPRGGAAQHIAARLEERIRENLKKRTSLFLEGSAGLATTINRPLLCLFDRNFELSVVLQHSWTYKPLVHDVCSMHLNRVTLEEPSSSGPTLQNSQKKSFEVGEGDFFWEANGRAQFPAVAAEVEFQIKQYKQAIQDINSRTGANLDLEGANDMMQQSTQNLMSAISQLPQLTEKKRTLDKHTNLLHHLLREIRNRELDQLYQAEEEMLQGKGDLAAVERTLQRSQKNAMDSLRFVLVYLLTTRTLPTDSEFARLEESVGSQDPSHLAALWYVRRMRRMNLTGKVNQAAAASEVAGNQLLSWAGNTFGQGLNTLTKGMKNMMAGEQQAAVTVAVEGLMDAKPVPELESFAYFDPKGPAGRANAPAGMAFKEAIVFVVGGGNYLEAESLMTWASKTVPAKNIVYGATELLTGEQFAQQLAALGKMSI